MAIVRLVKVVAIVATVAEEGDSLTDTIMCL